MSLIDKEPQERAIIERSGGLFPVVTPVDIQGNDRDNPLDFVREWAKFFSLPSGRMESVFNLALWGFTGGWVALCLPFAQWVLIPSVLIMMLLGLVASYAPQLTPVLALRMVVVILMVASTLVVL